MIVDNEFLTYFGVVAERRGIFDTLEVFRKALSRGAHVKLLIIGPIDRSDKKRFLAAIHSPNNSPHPGDDVHRPSGVSLTNLIREPLYNVRMTPREVV